MVKKKERKKEKREREKNGKTSKIDKYLLRMMMVQSYSLVERNFKFFAAFCKGKVFGPKMVQVKRFASVSSVESLKTIQFTKLAIRRLHSSYSFSSILCGCVYFRFAHSSGLEEYGQ